MPVRKVFPVSLDLKSLNTAWASFYARTNPERSQQIRHVVQWSFVALIARLGLQFYVWVRDFERGGRGLYLPRPAGVEGWPPIAGLMNTKYFLSTGHPTAIYPATMFLLIPSC
jgi:hypothetical protein